MTAVLAQKGQIVIPKEIRDQMKLEAGDDFEVYLLDGEIILRPLAKARNQGLANILLNPPGIPMSFPKSSSLARTPRSSHGLQRMSPNSSFLP